MPVKRYIRRSDGRVQAYHIKHLKAFKASHSSERVGKRLVWARKAPTEVKRVEKPPEKPEGKKYRFILHLKIKYDSRGKHGRHPFLLEAELEYIGTEADFERDKDFLQSDLFSWVHTQPDLSDFLQHLTENSVTEVEYGVEKHETDKDEPMGIKDRRVLRWGKA